MTPEEKTLVHNLRLELLRANYPEIYIVDNTTLEAAEKSILENLEKNNLPPIILCGKHGVFFKGCQLVLEVGEL